jgi:uncharacterized membrane protein YphA (DoxX/SURF4 family)
MNETSRWRKRLLTGLCWFIAMEIFLLAPMKFYPGGAFGYPSYTEKFVNWGYPAWFAYVIGAGEILCGVFLIRPRRRFFGAALFSFILTGAVTTHIINHDTLTDSLAAPIHLILCLIIALPTWPPDWRALFTRASA